MKTETMRLDTQLVALGLAPSREKAKEAIAQGHVLVDQKPVLKPSFQVSDAASITVLPNDACSFVSRGALKLEKALDVFGLDLTGMLAADIGASTGGFTQCMLVHGARHVFAIDVGHGQLHPSLCSDSRVTNLEGCDARTADPHSLSPRQPFNFVATDVSFISLSHIMPVLANFAKDDHAHVVCLIKPQFEAGPQYIGKHGIVKDPSVHKNVIEQVCGFAFKNGLEPLGLDFSPITGTKGNIEYLLHAQYIQQVSNQISFDISQVVAQAHQVLLQNQ